MREREERERERERPSNEKKVIFFIEATVS